MKKLISKLLTVLGLIIALRFLCIYTRSINPKTEENQERTYLQEELVKLKARDKINAYIEELTFKFSSTDKSRLSDIREIEQEIAEIEQEAAEKRVETLIDNSAIIELKGHIETYKMMAKT